jgi:YaiO family outer membrane protein
VNPLDRPRARALYLAVLARDPKDEEAAVGLARTDAADECFLLAERGYRDVLARSPGNVDARAGLADVLILTGRLGAAEEVLDAGLREAPYSPELLSRRGRIANFRGDPATARFFLAEAQRIQPLDPEIQASRDRLFVGQVRLGQRLQIFPSSYDDLYTTDTSAVIRWQRLRFEAGAQVITRYGAERATRSGPLRTTVIDGRPTFGTFYHFGNGAWAGGSVGISAPALALPLRALTLSGFTPIDRRFSAHLSTAFWQYRDDRDVTIVSPALGYVVTDAVDLTARYWLTSVFAGNPNGQTTVEHVHSAGLRVAWRPTPRLSLGVDYTYGVQLERNPTAAELLDLRSHIVSLLGMWLIKPSFGVDATLSVERRSSRLGPDVFGPAVEAGVFARW